MVLFLINLLIDIKIDYWADENDCSGFMGTILPCSKDLWESLHREDWETRYKGYLAKRKSTEILKFGMLKASQQLEQDTNRAAWLEDLNAWSSRVDTFGANVILAALTLLN
jgi:hypothetical protein